MNLKVLSNRLHIIVHTLRNHSSTHQSTSNFTTLNKEPKCFSTSVLYLSQACLACWTRHCNQKSPTAHISLPTGQHNTLQLLCRLVCCCCIGRLYLSCNLRTQTQRTTRFLCALKPLSLPAPAAVVYSSLRFLQPDACMRFSAVDQRVGISTSGSGPDSFPCVGTFSSCFYHSYHSKF